MKKQIRRFSPHQTAKVAAVILAISSLPFLIPMMLFPFPEMDAHGNPVNFPMMSFWFIPVLYLVFGYISVFIGCLIYNLVYHITGGIEIDVEDVSGT